MPLAPECPKSDVPSQKVQSPNEESLLSVVDRSRRRFLHCLVLAGIGIAGLGAGTVQAAAAAHLEFGPARTFDFDGLIQTARERAAAPYREPPRPGAEVVAKIDYDEHGQIRYRSELALDANGPGIYPVTFFHLGKWFQQPMHAHVVEQGKAREDPLSPRLLFDAEG